MFLSGSKANHNHEQVSMFLLASGISYVRWIHTRNYKPRKWLCIWVEVGVLVR